MKKPNIRKPTFDPTRLRQLWEQHWLNDPAPSRERFARQVKLSKSRIRALLNDHPSERERINNIYLNANKHHVLSNAQNDDSDEPDEIEENYSGLKIAWT